MKHILMAGSAILLAVAAPASAATTITYTGAVVTWTAPTSGSYRVTGVGAQGYSAQAGFSGGRGALIAGTFNFTAGQLLQIAVGGQAVTNPSGWANGGGGGGTFLVDALNNPLLVAGGGGGTRAAAQQNGTDASITEFAYAGSGSSATYTPTLKTNALGLGGSAAASSWGSAGAGFYGDGASDAPFGTGGKSWANGLAGGVDLNYAPGTCSGANGGFGGGGAGAGCGGGGGGGGYSGGDGGFIAGGGGSFNAGTDRFAEAGVGYGNGWLTIESLSAGVPEPAAWAMMLAGFGLVGSAMRRRSKVSVTFA